MTRCVEERHDGAKTAKEKKNRPRLPPITALYIVLFDAEVYGVAGEFWQQTGLGVSSRFAEQTRHYQPADNHANGDGEGNELGADRRTYLEEQYDKNMPLRVAALAKRALSASGGGFDQGRGRHGSRTGTAAGGQERR